MSGAALETTFRAASGRITGALAARYRDLDLAEEAFAEACLRAVRQWTSGVAPERAEAWLYRVADRVAIDLLRRSRTRAEGAPEPSVSATTIEDQLADDERLIPDERLRLIFVCCHPAVAAESRAALTLRLVCGLSTHEIARAFLVSEATLAQRLVRAKRKIAEAGVPFEIPGPETWPERLEAVLSTLEVAYSLAHEDATATGPHRDYADEIFRLTRLLADLLPNEAETFGLAALVRYAEARRPARIDPQGVMVSLSDQDPALWNTSLIAEAEVYLHRAARLAPDGRRVLEAAIQASWCGRSSLRDPPPWATVLDLYDALLTRRDDPIVRINRAVATAEVFGPARAMLEVDDIFGSAVPAYAPFFAVRADLCRRLGRKADAVADYREALKLVTGPAERRWLMRRMSQA